MSKKSRFRRPYNKPHDKRSQTLFKSARQRLDHIYWSMGRQLRWKNFLLVICKILGLVFNTLRADDKYSHLNCNKLMKSIQMQLSKKQKTFSNLDQILQIFKTNMSVIAYVFPKLQTAKDVVRKCLESLVSEDSWTSNMGNGPKYCWNLQDTTFIIIFDQCERNWTGESLL